MHQRQLSEVAHHTPAFTSGPLFPPVLDSTHDSHPSWTQPIKLAKERYKLAQRDGWYKAVLGSSRPARGPSKLARATHLDDTSPSSKLIDRGQRLLALLCVIEPASEHSGSLRSHVDVDAGSMSHPRNHRRRPGAIRPVGYVIVVLLLVVGLRAISSHPHSSRLSRARRRAGGVQVSQRDPQRVLSEYASLSPALRPRSLPGIDNFWIVDPTNPAGEDEAEGDTTAIVLHWKRTDNVKVIVAHLCQHEFFSEVFVWNNNPEIRLSTQTFKSSGCPTGKLRIFNSPRNMLFLARYLACAQSSSLNCYFQDDDWLVRPLRAMYSQFSRDPEGPVVVSTNERTAGMYALEWCFFNQELHTCFSWVGTGAFVARSHVLRFMAITSHLDYSREMLGHADNSFTLFQNEPPYVLASKTLDQLPSPFGHSDGEGIARNKRYIHQGLQHLSDYLSFTPSAKSVTLPQAPLKVDTTRFMVPRPPPLPPHPYTHHARAPCSDDTCLFLTNIAMLPPPDSVPYPGPSSPVTSANTTAAIHGTLTSLEDWENHLGHLARGWMETGKELFNEEEAWYEAWGYAGAVDGETDTAFRSPDVIKADDYIAIGLLSALDASWLPQVVLKVMLEEAEQVLPILVVEVSTDGYHWYDTPSPVAPPKCRTSSQRSTAPDLSFPLSYLSSPKARKVRLEEELMAESAVSSWWSRRQRQGRKVRECRFVIETRMYEATDAKDLLDEEGWRFVRLRSKIDATVGWGVYEMWIENTA